MSGPIPTRETLLTIPPGEAFVLTLAPGDDPKALRSRLATLAHRAWGAGTYTTQIEGSRIELRRCVPPPAAVEAPEPPAPPPTPEPTPPPAAADSLLTREQAAAYCQKKGLRHVTAETLRHLAGKPTGPVHHRFGRLAYYRPADLDAWITSRWRTVAPKAA